MRWVVHLQSRALTPADQTFATMNLPSSAPHIVADYVEPEARQLPPSQRRTAAAEADTEREHNRYGRSTPYAMPRRSTSRALGYDDFVHLSYSAGYRPRKAL